MEITLTAIGRARGAPEQSLIEAHAGRFDALARSLGFRPLRIREWEPSKASRPEERKTREAEQLMRAIEPGRPLIALDERGEDLSSRTLTKRLARWRDDGVPGCTFMIGGADGLDPALVAKANHVMAFGSATWPHLLVRAMLVEQIYRAATILAGHPYHRD